MGRCGKPPAREGAGKRGDHGRGGRDCGIDGWGAAVGGAVVGGWDFAVDGLRLGRGELEIGGWDCAGRGACAMSIGDLRFGVRVLGAWGWCVIRATGVWGLGRSLGRTELYGSARGLRFGRRDVACCLRSGPESGLGFRI